MTTYYVTDKALTSGKIVVIKDFDLRAPETGQLIGLKLPNRISRQYLRVGTQAFLTKEAAIEKFESLRKAKIASHKKAIAKLESLTLTFE